MLCCGTFLVMRKCNQDAVGNQNKNAKATALDVFLVPLFQNLRKCLLTAAELPTKHLTVQSQQQRH